MTDRLKDKIAIVTGGARGQGRSTAELFADEGATVYACDVDAGESRHRGVHHRKVDIANEADWSALVAEVRDAHSRVDILVNNAAEALGVGAIAQAAIGMYADTVREELKVSVDRSIVCGVSFGYADPEHPANAFRTERADLADVVAGLPGAETVPIRGTVT